MLLLGKNCSQVEQCLHAAFRNTRFCSRAPHLAEPFCCLYLLLLLTGRPRFLAVGLLLRVLVARGRLAHPKTSAWGTETGRKLELPVLQTTSRYPSRSREECVVTRKSCTGQEAKPRPCFRGQGVPICTLNIKLPQKQPPDSRQSAESSAEQTGHDPDNLPGFLPGISGGSCCQHSSFPGTRWALPTAQVAARSGGGLPALTKALIPSPRAGKLSSREGNPPYLTGESDSHVFAGTRRQVQTHQADPIVPPKFTVP